MRRRLARRPAAGSWLLGGSGEPDVQVLAALREHGGVRDLRERKRQLRLGDELALVARPDLRLSTVLGDALDARFELEAIAGADDVTELHAVRHRQQRVQIVTAALAHRRL